MNYVNVSSADMTRGDDHSPISLIPTMLKLPCKVRSFPRPNFVEYDKKTNQNHDVQYNKAVSR